MSTDWTSTNCTLRKLLLQSLEPDFISLNETHLSSDVIELDGYAWYGYQLTTHRRAVKASSGVGIFVNKSVFDQFCAKTVDKVYDGILSLRFEHRLSQYLFFSHLLALMYSNDADSIYICSEMNSRIADLKDYVDDIAPRVALDMGKNKHGEAFIEF